MTKDINYHALKKPGPLNDLHNQFDLLKSTSTTLSNGTNPQSLEIPSGEVVQPTACNLHTGGNVNSNKRTFVLVDYPSPGKTYGYYKGKYPKQVAKKIANFLSKKHNIGNNDQKFVVFTIREITQKSKKENKEYKYIGTRIKLNKPNEVNYNGKIIYHNYNVLVSKYDDSFNNSFEINKVV